MPSERHEAVTAATLRWVEGFVIALNICPFAKPVFPNLEVRVFEGEELEVLATRLEQELRRFANADPETLPTSILVTPDALEDFLDYNDFLEIADAMLRQNDLDGLVQIASFHPLYRFGGVALDDPSHYSNRSPYPMFHFLREDHVEQAIEQHPDTLAIPDNNIARLQELGLKQVRALRDTCVLERTDV
mgnify:CR=1 FL=1|jgi:uncharacterized protein